MKEKYMFQYALATGVIMENTGLITLKQAKKLWRDNIEHIKKHWNDEERPQMYIWKNCKDEYSYGKLYKYIDYSDCVFENGMFYKKVMIK